MNKKKPLNITLAVTIAVVAVSLLGGRFLSSPVSSVVMSAASETKTFETAPLKPDTLLSIQSLKGSGCGRVEQFSATQLLALPQQQFTTHHSWSEEAELFSGPLLQDVLDKTCSNAEKIKLTALNDYAIDMDFSEVKKFRPIIALSLNGKRLSIREKGPLWVMLPLDKHKIFDRSMDGLMIWQLSDITILKANDKTL